MDGIEEYPCDRCGEEPAVTMIEAANDSADAVCKTCADRVRNSLPSWKARGLACKPTGWERD